jgi:phage host-nuclease inhibitor protein Gam
MNAIDDGSPMIGETRLAHITLQLCDEVERLQLENNRLHTECGHLQADLAELHADIENAVAHAMDERHDGDTRHCTCVPMLRGEVERLRAALSQSCEDNRSVALAEPGRTRTCPLERELRAERDECRRLVESYRKMLTAATARGDTP